VNPLAAIFWGAAGACVWVLAGYPASLVLRRPRPWRHADALPTVSVIVPAYREREALAAKLGSLAELDYPRALLEVIVAVDEDEELVRVARAARRDARVLFSPERRGKPAAINRALAEASGDAVLLTDANNVLDRGSLRAAVSHLGDETVWAVAGRRGETGSAYARYEDAIRRLESRSGSVAAASGELILVRRERAPRLPEEVVNDDLWILCELVRGGGRVVYEPLLSSEEAPVPEPAEFARRARITAGRWQLLGELRDLPAGFALRLASHKAGRLALAPLLLIALGSSLLLVRRPLYRAAVGVQLAAYAPGVAALVAPPALRPTGRLARASKELVLGCAGTIAGIARGVRRAQSNRWEPVR
jgi:cellulose synthase/poly-beta-1,6-N-acetylglucosamine synthase-like glycosyltransferase